MNNENFRSDVEEMFNECLETLDKKGTEYQNNPLNAEIDVFRNFKRTGEELGIDKMTVLFIFMKKHWDSISGYVKNKQAGITPSLTEPINGRIMDLINYLLILNSMIKENNVEEIEKRAKEREEELKKMTPIGECISACNIELSEEKIIKNLKPILKEEMKDKNNE